MNPAATQKSDGTVTAFAPAKINLYLHVTGRRADGYHLLDSLIVFADIGDRITAAPAATLSLAVNGPEARHLAGLGDDNLVLRAARLVQARAGIGTGAALSLCKHLPVASGIGGGSSDAAAALRALAILWHCRLDPDDPATAAWAAALGADVPACLAGGALWVGGIGEELAPADGLPGLAVVLANPRIALPTAAVFRARSGGFGPPGRFDPMPRDAVAFTIALARRRNDLTDAAIGQVPAIGRVLEALARLPGALLSRMSGSGATCFALFVTRDAAQHAATLLARAEPGWWVRAGALLAPPRPAQPAA
ncbi:MAG: 4-(cytidine 5'-diphospho)-2-C-methyl-D-erythritol kinase [Stellaceae bacterium]